MFIRYNQGAKYFEYDTSALQNGSGPWVILPLDGNVGGGPTGNIAFTDRTNTFNLWQKIAAGYPVLLLTNTAQAADAKNWRLENLLHFYISSTNDADNAYQVRFTFGRDGSLAVPGVLGVTGVITGASNINAGGQIAGGSLFSRGNNGNLFMYDSGGPANARMWSFGQPNTGDLYLVTNYDSGQGVSNVIRFYRGGQVEFLGPWTQLDNGAYFPNRSSNPGLLDHYEEGSWTPTLSSSGGGGGTTYNWQDGRYTKIGQIVTVFYQVGLSSANWVDGAMLMGGLPYPCSEMYVPGHMDYWTATTNFYEMKTHLPPNGTQCYFVGRANPGTTGHDVVFTAANYSTAGPWRGSFTYRTTT